MLFSFAGSSHSKYTTYLLEFLTNFELESSRELRETTLNAMLVNLSGMDGAFAEGDIIQEFFNRLLEAILERKGADFGDTFIRQVISRNLHHMGRVKTELRDGLGLAAKTGRHSEPHAKPEVRILLKEYARHELHSRRPGRTMDYGDVDNFQRGWEKLAKGKLQRWVAETVHSRTMGNTKTDVSDAKGADSDDEDSEDEEDTAEVETTAPTFGSMRMINGQFIVDTMDFEETIREFTTLLKVDKGEESETNGETTEMDEGYSE
jgi:hypothetical protein